jgi:hypothetical protein
MKITLIVLNLIAAALVFPAMKVGHDMYVMSGTQMYVALDRANLINREKLAEAFPEEIKNDRILIPKRFMNPNYKAYWIGLPCVAGFAMNALLIALFWKSTNYKNDEK